MIIKVPAATLVCSTAAYTAGDSIGPLLTLTHVWDFAGQAAILQSIVVQDLAAQNSAIDFIFFDANPSATTFTDNGALTVADADLPKIVGTVSLLASDYVAFADSSAATVKTIALPVNPLSGSSLYCALVARGTPTYPTGADVSLSFGFIE